MRGVPPRPDEYETPLPRHPSLVGGLGDLKPAAFPSDQWRSEYPLPGSRCVSAPEQLPSLSGDYEHEEEEEPADVGEGPETVEDREDLVVEIEEGSDPVED